MATGGSIESVTIGGRRFPVDSEEDVTQMLGGFSNETKLAGDGSGRQIKKRVPWSIKSLKLICDPEREDTEYLQALADESNFVPITMKLVDGTIYGGQGQIEGDIEWSSQDSSASIELKGPGKLEQI
jgi:hypothetical protein